MVVAGVDPTVPVEPLHLFGVPVGDALRALARSVSTPTARIGFTMTGGVSLIAPDEVLERATTVRVYDVGDLIGADDDGGAGASRRRADTRNERIEDLVRLVHEV